MLQKRIIFAISGTELTAEERKLFLQNPIYGFILFSRNIDNAEQLKALVNDLKSFYDDYEPLIFVDQEGGRVARLKAPLVPEYPPAASFGRTYETDRTLTCAKVYDNYSRLMHDLKNFKIDSPCAPVADLLHDGASSVIGNRSFSSTVETVVELCTKAIEAINGSGGIAIIKHIPGHGRATCDSHHLLPKIDTPLDELDKTDFEIFRQLSKNTIVGWAMVAHIVYEFLDNSLPATFSQKVIKFIKNNIGFKGILVSDDICMGALHGAIGEKYLTLQKTITSSNPKDVTEEQIAELRDLHTDFTHSVTEAAKKTLEAGIDFVLHCSGDIEEMKEICVELSGYYSSAFKIDI